MAIATGTRKKDQIHDLIMEGLYNGKYSFGQRILVKELSDETGVSRQPIMAALNALNAEGFVVVMAQVGCEVISPTRDDITDFYLMFSRLEGLMAELAAKRGTAAQRRRLALINAELSAIPGDEPEASEQYRQLNRAFHSLIHTMAQSPMLNERQTNLFAMSDFFLAETVGFKVHLSKAADEHDFVVRALEAGDADAARMALEAHILSVRDSVLSALES